MKTIRETIPATIPDRLEAMVFDAITDVDARMLRTAATIIREQQDKLHDQGQKIRALEERCESEFKIATMYHAKWQRAETRLAAIRAIKPEETASCWQVLDYDLVRTALAVEEPLPEVFASGGAPADTPDTVTSTDVESQKPAVTYEEDGDAFFIGGSAIEGSAPESQVPDPGIDVPTEGIDSDRHDP